MSVVDKISVPPDPQILVDEMSVKVVYENSVVDEISDSPKNNRRRADFGNNKFVCLEHTVLYIN